MAGSLLLLSVVALIAASVGWRIFREATIIYAPHVGLLYRDGRFVRELPPGRYIRFDPLKRTKVIKISLAEAPTQFGETTVLSKDQFSFKLGLAPVLKVTDPRTFIEAHPASEGPMYHFMTLGPAAVAVQSLLPAAAIEVVATRTLSEILADTPFIAESVRERMADQVPGATVERVLLTGISLPPETRKMFTDVERARMEGQASLERARAEQAALRTLANGARLLTDNPALANLRLLQAIETSKAATTIVIGNDSGLYSPARTGGNPQA